MTREEAIAILNHNVSACLHGTEWGEALNIAIEVLEQTKWIPCSEKSPDKNERLALLYDNGLVSGGKYLGDRTYDVDFPDQNKKTRVVAWMPIPPSYEPQESDDCN